MEAGNLLYLTLKLTNRCNLKCAMCGQVFSPERSSDTELKLEAIRKILDQASFARHIYLFGGEPLLYHRLPELLKLLQNRNMISRITTNGTLLAQYSEDIVKFGVSAVEISLDSHKKDVLEKIRGLDVYDQIIKGIECLVKEKKRNHSAYPKININCVVLPYNFMELSEFVDFVREDLDGVEGIFFQYPMITTQEQGEAQRKITHENFHKDSISWKWFHNPAQQLTEGEIWKLYDGLELLEKDPLVDFRAVNSRQELKMLLSAELIKKDSICECPFTSLTILPNGDVTFCTDFPDIILGNVYETSLDDIWRGDKSQLFRKYLNTKGNLPICASCYHADEKLIGKYHIQESEDEI